MSYDDGRLLLESEETATALSSNSATLTLDLCKCWATVCQKRSEGTKHRKRDSSTLQPFMPFATSTMFLGVAAARESMDDVVWKQQLITLNPGVSCGYIWHVYMGVRVHALKFRRGCLHGNSGRISQLSIVVINIIK